jgi:hypothetical protein
VEGYTEATFWATLAQKYFFYFVLVPHFSQTLRFRTVASLKDPTGSQLIFFSFIQGFCILLCILVRERRVHNALMTAHAVDVYMYTYTLPSHGACQTFENISKINLEKYLLKF